MMEEIDRFQVPSAVQEAEMQAEMQPLVSQICWLLPVGDDRPVFWSCFLILKDINNPGCSAYEASHS